MRSIVSPGFVFMALTAIGAIVGCGGDAPQRELEDRSEEDLSGISTDDTGKDPPPVKLPPEGSYPPASYTIPDCPPGFWSWNIEVEKTYCQYVTGDFCTWAMGYSTISCEDKPLPIPFGAPNVIAVAAGANTTYALGIPPFNEASDTRAAVYSWGNNADYELGNGTTTNATNAVVTLWAQGNPVTGIAAGDEDACALMSDGTVQCWGTVATLPSAIVDKTPTPIAFPAGVKIKQITHGRNHSCALATSETAVYCWGNNDKEQLGDATSSAGRVVPFKAPLTVSGSVGILAIAAGGSSTCALESNGTVWCWGDNERGSLGNGFGGPAAGNYTATPQEVGGTQSPAIFAVPTSGNPTLAGGGAGTFCGVVYGTGWECWGANDQGQAGVEVDGTPLTIDLDSPMPTEPGVALAPTIALGLNHSCVGGGTSATQCFGANSAGQLGTGTTSATPLPSPQNTIMTQLYENPSAGFTALAVGANHTCGVLPTSGYLNDANLACWGAYADGQISVPEEVQTAAGYVVSSPLEPSYTIWLGGSYGLYGE